MSKRKKREKVLESNMDKLITAALIEKVRITTKKKSLYK